MLREFVIWVYLRFWSMLMTALAVALAALGFNHGAATVELMQTGVKVPGIVVQMREKPTEPSTAGQIMDQLKSEPGLSAQTDPPAAPSLAATKTPEPAKSDPAKSEPGKAEPPKCAPSKAPVIKYTDPSGTERTYESTTFSCPPAYEEEDSVTLLVDPKNPDRRMIEPGLGGVVFWPLMLAGFGALFGVVAWTMQPRPERLSKLLDDPPIEDGRKIVALADFRAVTPGLALSGMNSPGSSRLKGIVASAGLLTKGEVPLDLCELTAYMAALAYEKIRDDEGKTDAIRVVDYLNDEARFPKVDGAKPFQHVTTFSGGSTEGFGFVLDGGAFIILRGTMGWSDWSRNLDAGMTGPNELLPPGMTIAKARHRGFSKAWDAVRAPVECWLAKVAPRLETPVVVAGHSLGGALSFLAGWELKSSGRNVVAVITFGAALPGDQGFADEYKTLGLEDRTLQLEFTQDIVPEAQKLVGYVPVGHVWEPKQLPFISHRAALASLPVFWIVSSLGDSLFKPKPEQKLALSSDGSGNKTEPAMVKEDTRPFKKRVFSWVRRLVIFVAFSSILALAAHKMQKRYGLALSVMSYRQIRAQRLAATGRSQLDGDDLAACYATLGEHLKAIRGSTPESPGVFSSIKGLPRQIASVSDLKWFNAFFAGRSW